jgi:hypothetical protein
MTVGLRIVAVLLLVLAGRAGEPDWSRVAGLAAAGPEDAATRAALLRPLVDQGLAAGRDEAWACLDLWLKAEWENAADLPAVREAFWRDWPCSSCQEAADWWSARWLLRREGAQAAAPRLARLAVARPDSEWGRRAADLLESLEADGSDPDSWLAGMDEASRAWWEARRASRVLHNQLLLLAPLSGSDAAVGAAVRMAVEEALATRPEVKLTVWDTQSDPLLTREQLALSEAQPVDAVLLPGLPGCLAALPGLDLTRPVVALGYEGPPPAVLHPRLHQFGLDPATLGAQAARLAADSLRLTRLASLGPATRAAMRTVDGFRLEAALRSSVWMGEKQWYFHGAKQLEHQAVAMRGHVDQGAGGWLVLGSPREGAVLAELLAKMPSACRAVGDAGLLEAIQGRIPDGLDGRLFWVSDWLPAGLAGLPDPVRRSWDGFRDRVRERQGREPGALESRSYESARLVLVALDKSRKDGRGLEAALRGLDEPSLFGGRVHLAGGQAAQVTRLAWTGRQVRVMGGMPVGKGTN